MQPVDVVAGNSGDFAGSCVAGCAPACASTPRGATSPCPSGRHPGRPQRTSQRTQSVERLHPPAAAARDRESDPRRRSRSPTDARKRGRRVADQHDCGARRLASGSPFGFRRPLLAAHAACPGDVAEARSRSTAITSSTSGGSPRPPCQLADEPEGHLSTRAGQKFPLRHHLTRSPRVPPLPCAVG